MDQDSVSVILGLTHLQHLNLPYNYLDGEDLIKLSSLPCLQSLILPFNEVGSNRSTDHRCLPCLSRLEQLDLSNNPIVEARPWLQGNEASSHLSNLTRLINLNHLSMNGLGGGVEDGAMYHFRTLLQLTHLSIRSNSLTDNACVKLAKLIKLKELDIGDNPISSQGMVTLLPLVNLVSLNVSHSYVADGGIYRISRMLKLRKLDLSNTRVTVAAVMLLADSYPYIQVIV